MRKKVASACSQKIDFLTDISLQFVKVEFCMSHLSLNLQTKENCLCSDFFSLFFLMKEQTNTTFGGNQNSEQTQLKIMQNFIIVFVQQKISYGRLTC